MELRKGHGDRVKGGKGDGVGGGGGGRKREIAKGERS